MKRYLKCVAVIGCLLLLFSVSLFAAEKYVSSKYSVYYHRQSCKKVRKIDPLIKVIYTSPKEALEAGKRPCSLCKPPTEASEEETKSKQN